MVNLTIGIVNMRLIERIPTQIGESMRKIYEDVIQMEFLCEQKKIMELQQKNSNKSNRKPIRRTKNIQKLKKRKKRIK